MATPITLGQPSEIDYPDSDGKPMADNTLQFRWIVTLQGNLDILFEDNPAVFVAGDLLWYPVQGRRDICAAPDTLVAFGRHKGYRGSYKQWQEGGIAPQVVFEVLSPNNRPDEMALKFQFYDTHGVEEYYLYDPDNVILSGWQRTGQSLQPIAVMHNWVSPRLKIRFDMSGPELVIYHPNGQKFLTFLELDARRKEAEQRAERERLQRENAEKQAKDERLQREKAEKEAKDERLQREKAQQQTETAEQQVKDERLQRENAEQQARKAQEQTDQERLKREQVEEQARRLADKLRELGIDPTNLSG